MTLMIMKAMDRDEIIWGQSREEKRAKALKNFDI